MSSTRPGRPRSSWDSFRGSVRMRESESRTSGSGSRGSLSWAMVGPESTSREGLALNRPNFLVLGAAKAGTTSLCHYLAQHPDVFIPEVKEPIFFDAEYERGLDYYWKKYFSRWSGQPAVGEGRVFNLYLPFVPPRIRESIPGAKLIAVLRNPVERAYSHWWHRFSYRDEILPFHEAIRENLSRIARGILFEGGNGARLWRDGLV